MLPRPLPAIDLQKTGFVRLHKFLPFSSRTNTVHPVRNDQLRDPLDSQPRSITRSSPSPPTSFTSRIHQLSSWWPVRGGHAQSRNVDVPLAQAKERVLRKKDEDIVPDEYLDPPSPDPDSQQPAAAVQTSTGEHGGERSCFCF
ncbi:hypothetical protein F4604DRAFT_1935181 [Suillus subluteus]|nr:hypothetical protein F4604DRAFT_1935181 [Suillus subluteus]